MRHMRNERRTIEQVREHYVIEKELAAKLRSASREERRHLYTSLYNELFQRVPHHTQLTHKSSPEERKVTISEQMKFLHRFLSNGSTFLEVGPGDCAMSLEVARHVKQVYAVDVSNEITGGLAHSRNFQLVISDGCSIPVPKGSIDVAYSNQLMEHLHPDDAYDQLQNIYNALSDGGVYVCITPNRLNGPHDVSRHFDKTASGFHLKEYSISELKELFRNVGFSKIRAYVGARGVYVRSPLFPLLLCEAILDVLPYALRKPIALSPLFRLLLGVRLAGTK